MLGELLKTTLVFAGILTAAIVTPIKVIDPKLQSFYDEFQEEVRGCPAHKLSMAPKVYIKFKERLYEAVGQCTNALAWYSIEVDKRYWESLDYNGRYSLMMHELTHCVLKMGHTDYNNLHYMNSFHETSLDFTEVKSQMRKIIKQVCGE